MTDTPSPPSADPKLLEAGRELDAQVAQALGWKYPSPAHASAGIWERPDGEFVHVSCVPRYSTEIAAAWLVVERMRDEGFSFTITGTPLISSVGPLVMFRYGVRPPLPEGTQDEDCFAGRWNGERLPEVICRCALAALAWARGRGAE